MMTQIEEILHSMQNKHQIREKIEGEKTLENSSETWKRIGNKDSFDELNFDSDAEKENFLKEWTETNSYSNM